MKKNRIRIKREKKKRRHSRIRTQIMGSAERPRLCVFRSLRYIYAQLIDDQKGNILLAVSDRGLTGSKIEKAKEVGKLLAQKAAEQKIREIVFDRAGYKYHGRVKALAEGAREGGLKF